MISKHKLFCAAKAMLQCVSSVTGRDNIESSKTLIKNAPLFLYKISKCDLTE